MGKEQSKFSERGSSDEILSVEAGIENILNAFEKNRKGERALDILKIASYFTAPFIEKSIFLSLMSNEQELREALKLLEKYSLIDLFWETGVFTMDKDISEKVRDVLIIKNEEKSALKKALKFFSDSAVSEEMIVHINSVLSFAKKYPEVIEENSTLLLRILKDLRSSKSVAEAFLFASEVFEVFEKSLGEFHKDTLHLQGEMVELTFLCDKMDRALELATDLYEKESKIKGHKSISPILKVIAKLKLEKKPESETQIRELVFGQVTVSETKNNSVLSVWDEYATLLITFDLHDEALKILEQLLVRRCELLSPDDDDIDDIKHTIGNVYLQKNEFDKGMEMLEGVYERRKARYGEFSLKCLSVRKMMMQGYAAHKKYDEALSICKDTTEKFRHITGKSPLYYKSLNLLAKLNFIQDEYEKSYEMNLELYEHRKAEFGEKDDSCFAFRGNMVSCMIGQNKASEAAKLYKEGLTFCLENYGMINSKTLKWCNILESEGLVYTYCDI